MVARALRCSTYAARQISAWTSQELGDDVALDGKLQLAWPPLRDGAGVQPPAILARFVEGGRETRVTMTQV